MTLAQERILKGQCPLCGKEAAPYRLCYDHRQRQRVTRILKRGSRLGVFKTERRIDGNYYSLGPQHDNEAVHREMDKWQTPWNLPDSDKRSRPRLRGVAVDIERMLLGVVYHIGRPCTIEEILGVWGKLRDRRTSPLPVDLAALLKAEDKRKRKAEKRADLSARCGNGSSGFVL